MSGEKKKQQKKKKFFSVTLRGILAGICLALAVSGAVAFAADESADNRKLQNGSFEEGQTWTDKNYYQPLQKDVPSWNTTAFEGKIELFRENMGTYVAGVTLKASEGSYAAELNADEESTLYQNVKTSPSSVYEWGLDHGGRTTMDTMALVIGPKQNVNPSKPKKNGRDQLMQMVDWLNIGNDITAGAEPKKYTVYSKKFADNGTFADNDGNNAFSLTPSTIYTEEWHIWIMADGKATSGTNPWGKYGSNAESSTGAKSVDLSKYYLYTVPAGQTETLFGFVSVGCQENKGKTFGNFLDNIKFQIYHPLSGSSTTHGSAVVGGSDGTTEGEGASEGHKITVDDKLTTYVTDGEALKIQAVIKKADEDDGCEFVGVYYTKQDENGDPQTIFLQLAGCEIEDTGSLTDAEKKGKWIKSTNTNGDIIYTYYLEGLTSATDLHFVFIKSPTITYDPNGGKAYVVERTYNTDEEANVYSFKPASGHEEAQAGTDTIFIDPYVSHAAEGQNDGWKFMGWLLTGDTVDVGSEYTLVNKTDLGSLLLPAEHTIACDYTFDGITLSDNTKDSKVQYFKIYSSKMFDSEKDKSQLSKIIQEEDSKAVGVTWEDTSNPKAEIAYANVHRGLTLVAQWRWLQAFIPQVGNGTTYTDSVNGGTVEITSVTDKSDANYNAAYNANGGKSYHATTDETITATATAKDGFTFEGWYDASGNLLTTNTTYSYTETKESVNTYYARFSGSVTQTYIRQVKNGDVWEDTTDDKIGTLGRYTYTDAVGNPISSTATAGTGYKFVGWYDSTGKKVADNMLTNDGATISYTTTGNATYYARFETTYTVNFAAQTKLKDGNFNTDNVGGTVSVASVTDVANAAASSKATANSSYKFLGWYDASGNQLSMEATYSPTITSASNNVTYYARFEVDYKPTVENKVYLSFVAESKEISIPSVFDGRDAGTGKNTSDYGLDNKFGNTISTGFKYSLDNITDVSTIQITVTVPASAYVKVGGTGSFTGNGTDILTDGSGVKYNKGSIQQISGTTTLTYHWDASGLQAGTTYGFIIDNLYAPGATATITVNGTAGKKVTNDNGVVNTASGDYRGKSHYLQD